MSSLQPQKQFAQIEELLKQLDILYETECSPSTPANHAKWEKHVERIFTLYEYKANEHMVE